MSRNRPEATGPQQGEGPEFSGNAATVLVIWRGAARAGELVGALQSRGMLAMQAAAPREALVWARTVPPRLVVLDMATRGASMLLHEFRAQGRQVVALSDDPGQRHAALEAGCLEALHHTDPCDELALHVATLIRRPSVQPVGQIACGPLQIDLGSRRVVMREREVHLPPKQFDFAAYLGARPDHLMSAKALLQDLWGEVMDPRKVHLTAHRVRRNLGEPVDSDYFVARRGFGYGFFRDGTSVSAIGVAAHLSHQRTR